VQLERTESRKKKEFEVSRVLDMQVERNRNDRAIGRIQELQIGEKILEDVKLHEQEEQK
jgi:hypothetical protein